jgi:hypothetical protein
VNKRPLNDNKKNISHWYAVIWHFRVSFYKWIIVPISSLSTGINLTPKPKIMNMHFYKQLESEIIKCKICQYKHVHWRTKKTCNSQKSSLNLVFCFFNRPFAHFRFDSENYLFSSFYSSYFSDWQKFPFHVCKS